MPENERMEYVRIADQLKPLIQDLEKRLPMYRHFLRAESQIQRLIAMVRLYRRNLPCCY
jgi:hypothetical protein